MEERIKDPRCLIDAEALASHVSVVSMSMSQPAETGKTGTRKGKRGATSSKRSGSKLD
jgi:hypothetical protein